jgi:hypothetical protein
MTRLGRDSHVRRRRSRAGALFQRRARRARPASACVPSMVGFPTQFDQRNRFLRFSGRKDALWVRGMYAAGPRLVRLVPGGCCGTLGCLIWRCTETGRHHPLTKALHQDGTERRGPGGCRAPGRAAPPANYGQHRSERARGRHVLRRPVAQFRRPGALGSEKRRAELRRRLWLVRRAAIAAGVINVEPPGGPARSAERGRIGAATEGNRRHRADKDSRSASCSGRGNPSPSRPARAATGR